MARNESYIELIEMPVQVRKKRYPLYEDRPFFVICFDDEKMTIPMTKSNYKEYAERFPKYKRRLYKYFTK